MGRIKELDYLKGVLILLVISFHLVHFEQLHPYAKQVVYAFHMPAFLLISGYLMNVGKAPGAFLRTLFWLFVPYIIMESGYIVMASRLPISEHVDLLTPTAYLDHLLLHPLGPYWYLHTLVLCGAIYYAAFYPRHEGQYSVLSLCLRFSLMGIAYYLLTLLPMKVGEVSYFLAGAVIRQSGKSLPSVFRPSPIAVLLFLLLIIPEVSVVGSAFSVLIVYFAISSLLWLCAVTPSRCREWVCFLGRGSLRLYVFSPIFTILCKHFVPYLEFDPTGLLFLLVSLLTCVSGSLAIGRVMDLTGISRFFFGKV